MDKSKTVSTNSEIEGSKTTERNGDNEYILDSNTTGTSHSGSDDSGNSHNKSIGKNL